MADKATAIANMASVTSYSAAGSTMVIGGFTTNEIMAIGGFILGALTFIINWVYRHRSYQLEKAIYDQRMDSE